MFWALIMEPYKRYTQCVQHSFHVSMASLDTSLAEETPVQVMVNYKERNFLLCTLKKNKMWQIPLDLNFEKGTNLTFLCNGRGPVHLTGYLLPTYDTDSEGSSISITSEEVEELEEKEINLIEEEKKKQHLKEEEKKKQHLKEEEKQKQHLIDKLQSLMEKDLKRKAESPKSGKKVKQAKKGSFSESNNQDDSEENSQFSEEDSDSDEDMEAEEVEEDEADDDEEKKEQREQEIAYESQKHEKKEIENQQQHRQKKKHDKQNKINGEEIQQEQQSKKQKKKMEQHTQQINQNEAKKRIVEGGVQVEDIKSGNGVLATSGKLLTVYYVGRCKIGRQEKKIDSCLQGNGFKFRLGKGQVIKGWDVGLVGMKVGGKRRLTIPSHMGYGAKGSLPTIPGNSTLVFDIELKNVN
ncbi:unnamed protein product [Lasius platythorax]|uniref:FK506-binding protein n=1 Tax=Lasius platythorax TaxID=488582 RepID=A0AAV2P820_9HYME